MTKKLKIIGPYTPEHPGPFCTRDGRPARIICTDRNWQYPLTALLKMNDGSEEITSFCSNGRYNEGISTCGTDLMNAEEVPVAREFWVNISGDGIYGVFEDKGNAILSSDYRTNHIRTIHVREVLPGDGE